MTSIVNTGFNSADTVILTSGANFADALAANALAGANDAPVISTEPTALSLQAASTIKSLGAKHVLIMGGEAAISTSVEMSLVSMGLSVERIAGSTRQETSLVSLSKTTENSESINTVIISSGTSFADALSISPYSYAKNVPVVLTENDGTLSDNAVSKIQESGATRAVIVGGSMVVSEQAKTSLEAVGLSVDRWWGENRYETSAEIARHTIEEGMSLTTCAIATGTNFPDALAGGALIGSKGGVLLLAADGYTTAIDEILAPNKDKVAKCYMLGGANAVSSDLESYTNKVLS